MVASGKIVASKLVPEALEEKESVARTASVKKDSAYVLGSSMDFRRICGRDRTAHASFVLVGFQAFLKPVVVMEIALLALVFAPLVGSVKGVRQGLVSQLVFMVIAS